MQDKLISRKKECEDLQRCLDSDRSEFVIISGRRRIGKTYLIDKFFSNDSDKELHAGTSPPVQETPTESGDMV